MTSVRLLAKPPFDFDQALQYMSRSPDEVLEHIDGDVHRRVLPGPALVEIRSTGCPPHPAVEVWLLAGTIDKTALERYIRHIYRLDDNRKNLATGDELADRLVAGFPGLPLVQQATPYEALVWAVLGQQINVAFAYRLKRRFIEQFGEPVGYEASTYYAFPTPERVARLDHERDLLPLQFSRQKSRYIIEASRAICDGAFDFQQLENLDDQEALFRLMQLTGIGQWTAEYILMRGFARRDVIPAGDAGLRYAIGNYLGIDGNASESQVRELAERWKPYRAEISFRIWFSFQQGWFGRSKSQVAG